MIFCKICFRLFEGSLIGPWVDRKKEIAPLHILPLFEVDTGKGPPYLGLDRNR